MSTTEKRTEIEWEQMAGTDLHVAQIYADDFILLAAWPADGRWMWGVSRIGGHGTEDTLGEAKAAAERAYRTDLTLSPAKG